MISLLQVGRYQVQAAMAGSQEERIRWGQMREVALSPQGVKLGYLMSWTVDEVDWGLAMRVKQRRPHELMATPLDTESSRVGLGIEDG